jgi:glycosyltransferase involved in cell wall biosynthesis
MQRIKHASKLGDRTGDPDAHDISFLVLFDGWVEDVVRFHASLDRHAAGDWELVVVDNPVEDAASDELRSLDRTRHRPLRDTVGYAAGRNLGLRQATGRILCIVDTSVELEGDVVAPLGDGLAAPDVGLVGRWGVCTDDGHRFDECDGPDVDGVEGYFMALRRADLARIGSFDAKFRFYRNADIDFSFQVRAAGLRTIIDPALPLVRHEHRLWTNTPEARRDELSRKNFFRFRDHWGDRTDLLTRR